MIPLNSAVRQLVYTESGRGVKTVVVDGRVVIDNGVALTINEADLRKRVEELAPTFQRDFAEVQERISKLRPYLLEAHRRTWEQDVGMNRLFTGR